MNLRQENTSIEKNSLFALSAIDNAEDIDLYQEILDDAITNKQNKKIKNIALSGIYGAGKSTIIDTYLKNRPNLKPLRISISNFNGKPEINEIEQEILNQIFYQNSFETFALDFKNYKPINKPYIFLISCLLFIYLISLLVITKANNNFILKNISNYIQQEYLLYINYTSIVVATLGTIILIYFLINFLKKKSIIKIGYQGHQLELQNTNSSILNKNLNEITYFFNNNPYEIVIFEDLDRLNHTEIFDILRNLNFIINNTPVRRNNFVIFLYAIREDIFEPEERVKFFELIIPVRPYSNISNSKQRLIDWNENLKLNLSRKTINSISPFLTDTRLIKNTINEFIILKNGISDSVSDKEDKIFALVLYKNLNPEDFNLLIKRSGLLTFIISLKNEIIELLIETYEQSLNEKQKFIEDFKFKCFNSLQEYRQSILFEHFYKNGISLQDQFKNRKDRHPINSEEITSEAFLYKIADANIVNSYNSPITKINNDVIKDYESAKKILDEKSKKEISKLSLEINDLNTKIHQLRSYKISKLLNIKEIDIKQLIEIKTKEKSINDKPMYSQEEIDLSLYLLREGLINENYREYLTNYQIDNDNEFRISLLTHSNRNQFLPLNNPKALIEDIDLDHFNSVYILNNSLINYMLSHETLYERQLSIMLNLFVQKNWRNISLFVNAYLDDTSNEIGLFLNYLLYNNPNLYREIINYKNSKPLKQIILNSCKKETFEKLAHSEDFIMEFNNDTIFKENKIEYTQLKTLSEIVQFKLKKLDESYPISFLETIKELSAYEININNIKVYFGKRISEYEFYNSNYEFIKENDQQIFKYINNNIDKYICEVFTKLNNKQLFNNEQNFIELINCTDNNIDEIIEYSEINISNINQISSFDKAEKIISANKATLAFIQLNYLYNYSNSFEELSCNFINKNVENIKHLVVDLINSNDDNKNDIINIILNSNELSTTSFQKFLTNHNIKKLGLKQIIDYTKINDVEKLKLLIHKNFIEYSIESLENLLNKGESLLIIYLEKHFKIILIQGKLDLFFEKINDENLILKILDSTIPENFKQILCLDYFQAYNIESIQLMNKIISIIIITEINEHRLDQIFEIIKYKKGNIYLKIEIIIKYWNHLTDEEIIVCFNSLNNEYSRLVDNSIKKGSLDKNIQNSKLIEFLASKNFIKIQSTLKRITWTKNKHTTKF